MSALIKSAGGRTDVSVVTTELTLFNLIEYVDIKLFRGYGTVILIGQTGGGTGHYFVIAKDDLGQVSALDPQVGVCPEGGLIHNVGWDNIMNYIGSVMPGNRALMEYHLALPPSPAVRDIVARRGDDFSAWGYGVLTPPMVQPTGLTLVVLGMDRELTSASLKRMTDALRTEAVKEERRLSAADGEAARALAKEEADKREEMMTPEEKAARAAAAAAAERVSSTPFDGGAIRGRLPPSSPRRKARRSSFGRLRRYTRRRRASRSGRVGYRPKGKSRRA